MRDRVVATSPGSKFTVPVVASPALVAGLDLADGVDIAVAGDDAAMADAITRVLDDEAFRDGLVANARRAHRRLFSADAIDGALRAGSILCSP